MEGAVLVHVGTVIKYDQALGQVGRQQGLLGFIRVWGLGFTAQILPRCGDQVRPGAGAGRTSAGFTALIPET